MAFGITPEFYATAIAKAVRDVPGFAEILKAKLLEIHPIFMENPQQSAAYRSAFERITALETANAARMLGTDEANLGRIKELTSANNFNATISVGVKLREDLGWPEVNIRTYDPKLGAVPVRMAISMLDAARELIIAKHGHELEAEVWA